MKKSDQQAFLQQMREAGAVVNDLGKMNPNDIVTLDLDCYEQQDGAVTAFFSGIPGAQVSGVDLVHAIALLESIAHLVAAHIREDASAAGLRGEEPDENGDHSGVVKVSALEQRGVRMGYVQGAYCIGIVGVMTALIECETQEALGKVFSHLVRMGVSIYYHERMEAENSAQQAKAPGADIVISRGVSGVSGVSGAVAPFKTHD